MGDSLDILVVDDEKEIRNMLWTYLTNNHQHEVITVESVKDAMDILLYKKFNIAYIDHMLPETEGSDLCEYLHENHPDMKVALITASPDPKLKERIKKLGISFIKKPFRFSEILSVIEGYLSERTKDTEKEDSHFDIKDLESLFDLPKPSERVIKELFRQTEHSLNSLYQPKNYTETDRARAYFGIVAAKILGLKLPRREGIPIDQIYDCLMERYGQKKEFS
ncbi:MAG: response regulator [Candidatus Woesearchaeota archaeon]